MFPTLPTVKTMNAGNTALHINPFQSDLSDIIDIVYADIDLHVLVEINVNTLYALSFRIWNSHVIPQELSSE
jgi:hypothetical protein